MKILQVITDTDRRGAQVFATDLARELVGRGHEVETVALAPGANPSRLDLGTLGTSRLAPATLLALRSRGRSVDVVIAHGSSTLPACAVALLGVRTPFVYRQISDSLFWAPTRRRRLRVRVFLARARAIVALSDRQADVLVEHFGVSRSRLHVVPNGVPAEPFPEADAASRGAARRALGLPEDGSVVLSISALVPEKGVDLVIDAVAELGDDVRLLVVGDGPERSTLEDRARRRLGERASFTGPITDAGVAYATADVVVLASRGGDSMPATLVEAAFTGIPAVATPVGSIADVVVDGETGILVPIGDRSKLTAALRSLLGDDDARRALGHRARRHALERFEIASVATSWEAALQDALGPSGARRAERGG